MVQINTDTRKERQIRAPRNWKPPSKPLVPAGPTTVITVPAGSPGTTIQVPHPRVKGAFISVKVPASAKPGQAMLVPVPPEAATSASSHKSAAEPSAASTHHSGKSVVRKPSAVIPATPSARTSPTSAGTSSGGGSSWSTGG